MRLVAAALHVHPPTHPRISHTHARSLIPSPRGNYSQILGVYITIEQFWRPRVLNSVLPPVLCGALAFLVFGVDCRKLAARLSEQYLSLSSQGRLGGLRV